MRAHLAEIGRHVSPGAHAIRVVDGAGWRSASDLVAPATITLPTLPPYSPEPNPVETIWRFLRQTHCANRVFDSCDAIVDVCRNAWNALLETPHRVASITSRDRAQGNR
jgi:transposase